MKGVVYLHSMKIVVTHNSPDWDAITSVWLIKRFLRNWENAEVKFVPAGERLGVNRPRRSDAQDLRGLASETIEKMGNDEVIHVDTGLGPLDHHQTQDGNVSAASLAFDFVREAITNEEKRVAVERIVRVVVDIDHFGEVFWANPAADYHEFSMLGILEGLKLEKPGEDSYYVAFGMQMLDCLLHNFENRIWAEQEIAEKGVKFTTKWGEGMGFETINDTVLSLAQKMGYVLVVRKDPRKEYVRIKARPSSKRLDNKRIASSSKDEKRNADIDLTLIYEKLKKMDPDATWFLHVSKKMLLNGTVKNPKMRPTSLSLGQIIQVLEKV